MNIFSNIIRGGQLTLHALRMFRQVSYYLLLWGFLVFLIFFSLSMYDKTNSTMWGEYRDYQTANFLCQVMMCSKKVTVYVGKEPAVYTANSVINSAFFYTARDYIHKIAKEACIFSIKIAGSALLIVGIFFIWRGFKKTGEEFKRGARLSGFEKIKTAINNANKKCQT